MASLDCSYEWRGVNIAQVASTLDPALQVSISTPPHVGLAPETVTMTITLTLPGPNVPERTDLDDAMTLLGWLPI